MKWIGQLANSCASELASIRDAEALAKLPEAERKAWQALWAEVDSLLQKAGEP